MCGFFFEKGGEREVGEGKEREEKEGGREMEREGEKTGIRGSRNGSNKEGNER